MGITTDDLEDYLKAAEDKIKALEKQIKIAVAICEAFDNIGYQMAEIQGEIKEIEKLKNKLTTTK